MQPEKELEHLITDYCGIMHIEYIINQQQKMSRGGSWASIGTTKGIFDMCIFYHGRTLWVELKVAKRKLSADQEEFRAKLLRRQIISYVVRSLDDFKMVLEVN